MSEPKTTLKQRAEARSRRGSGFIFMWVGAWGLLWLLSNHLELLSRDVSRVWFFLLLMLSAVAGAWLYRARGNDCEVCQFVDVRSQWKHCPGCGIDTDLPETDRKAAHRQNASTNIETLYRTDRGDTTRKRAKRWRLASLVSMAIFFVLVFGSMPFYFVGPNVEFFAANWYWFLIGGGLPFLAMQLANAIRGLRCIACNKKLGNDAQGFTIASTKPSKHRWLYCPRCAHPIDLPRLR